MDEFLVCSDFCEENGHIEAAEALRSASKVGGKAFVVVERGWEYDDYIYEPDAVGKPGKVYFDREVAERVAKAENVRTFRENNVLDFCYNLETITNLPADDLARRIGQILGRPFVLPESDRPSHPFSDARLVDGDVTDEQMMAIADLFTIRFFYVVETEFAG